MFLMRRTRKFQSSLLSKLCIFAAGGCFLMGLLRSDQFILANIQIDYRKEQLAKPVLRLSGNDIINPSWNQTNLNEFLYRKVQIVASPNYAKTVFLRKVIDGVQGYQCVVPYLVKEENQQISKKGILVAKGFIPASHVENFKGNKTRQDQRIFGYVSRLTELKDSEFGIFSQTEYSNKQAEDNFRPKFSKQAKLSELENVQTASMVVIEVLRETRILDQKHPKYQSYLPPFSKTQTSALKLCKKPDQLSQEKRKCQLALILIFIAGGWLI